MLDRLRAMAVFAKTVETGSFRGAARSLGLSPSVVSHHVAQLEASLDVALLYRSTRRLTLTDDGKKLFAAAREMVAAAERGLGEMPVDGDPTGHLAVAVPAALIAESLYADLAAFATAFPRIAMTLHCSDAPVDIIREGIDVALRAGTLKDSSLKVKKLFDFPRTLVAAPSYVAARPTARSPRDLATWDWLRLKSRPSSAQFRRGARTQTVAFQARLVVDSADALLRLARHGLGLAAVPTAMAEPELRDGRLVQPIPAWSLDSPTVYAVWPANASRSGLALRLVDFLDARRRQRAAA